MWNIFLSDKRIYLLFMFTVIDVQSYCLLANTAVVGTVTDPLTFSYSESIISDCLSVYAFAYLLLSHCLHN